MDEKFRRNVEPTDEAGRDWEMWETAAIEVGVNALNDEAPGDWLRERENVPSEVEPHKSALKIGKVQI